MIDTTVLAIATGVVSLATGLGSLALAFNVRALRRQGEREKQAAQFPLKIGEKAADGAGYAGISPDTDRPFFATPEDAPLKYTFRSAAAYARQLNVERYLGHDDWRVPSVEESKVLLREHRAIGGFHGGGYWSSSRTLIPDASLSVSRLDARSTWTPHELPMNLRCVRG